MKSYEQNNQSISFFRDAFNGLSWEKNVIIYIFSYSLEYLCKMSESSHIRHEYLTLKDKIENKIKQLQLKCHDHSYTNSTEQLKSSNLQSGHSHSLSTLKPVHLSPNQHCCCSHFCIHDVGVSCGEQQSADRKKFHNQQFSITEALMENLKAQKQMNSNLKILSDKLSEISEKKSEPSQFFEDPNSVSSRRATLIHPHQTDTSSQEIQFPRSRSMNHSLKKNRLKFKKASKEHSSKRKQSKAEVEKKISEYYPLPIHEQKQKLKQNKNVCPIHDFEDITDQYQCKIKNKQIFKDSNHRNHKHEKNHLVGSYFQQEKSRKQLLAKIAKNFFNNYGVR